MNGFKFFLVTLAFIIMAFLGFNIYAGYQLKRVMTESTFGLVKFASQKKNTKVFVSNKDSFEAIFDSLPFSIFINELKDRDTFTIQIIRDKGELSNEDDLYR